MIHIEQFDDEGNARNLDDAGKLRLLASYFDVQDAITGSSEPEIQKDLLRMADRMEDLKVLAAWHRSEGEVTPEQELEVDRAVSRITAEGAVK